MFEFFKSNKLLKTKKKMLKNIINTFDTEAIKGIHRSGFYYQKEYKDNIDKLYQCIDLNRDSLKKYIIENKIVYRNWKIEAYYAEEFYEQILKIEQYNELSKHFKDLNINLYESFSTNFNEIDSRIKNQKAIFANEVDFIDVFCKYKIKAFDTNSFIYDNKDILDKIKYDFIERFNNEIKYHFFIIIDKDIILENHIKEMTIYNNSLEKSKIDLQELIV